MRLLLLLAFTLSIGASELPKDLKWETNWNDPVYSSPDAKKGGTYTLDLETFPLTLRLVGPDSNGQFANHTRPLTMEFGLIDIHPNTGNIIPVLATEWAVSKDKKTMYYRINKEAKWSDGKPLTADDFLFTIEMMRSKNIVAPWYNTYYTEQVKDIQKYDDYTISLTASTAKSPNLLHANLGIFPTPKHFYKGEIPKDFIKKYNWKIYPTVAAYEISDVQKGKSITLTRIKNWWGENHKYFKNRFNVDKVIFKLIRDRNVAFQQFLKGKVDRFRLYEPEYWHDKTNSEPFKKGYIYKRWSYNSAPQPSWSITLNKSHDLFKDINVRKAIAHAINVDKVNKTILRGDTLRQQSMWVGYRGYSDPSIKARAYDLTKVDEYLKKAGWTERDVDGIRMKNGKRLSFTLTHGRPKHRNRIVVLKEEAKKAGIEMKIKELDGAASFKAFSNNKFEAAYIGWAAGFYPQYWGMFHSENANQPDKNNVSNTSDKELDKDIMNFRNGTSDKEREALSRKIQRWIHDDGAIIPLWLEPFERIAHWGWFDFPKEPTTALSGYIMFPFTVNFGGMFWIDEAKKKEILDAQKSGKNLGEKTIIFDKYKLK
ncbi:MAG: ABC transporter substrate-binding protein [Halobacteriovoraceae bacterium]|nr:ABC transporter substrate-binding protein [Halobacteriovoraceae bacterium]